jgi:hypothetical protein
MYFRMPRDELGQSYPSGRWGKVCPCQGSLTNYTNWQNANDVREDGVCVSGPRWLAGQSSLKSASLCRIAVAGNDHRLWTAQRYLELDAQALSEGLRYLDGPRCTLFKIMLSLSRKMRIIVAIRSDHLYASKV